jgi:HD-GYP domain-containing protein (c-di-GMP phosphodiesterase class II)
MEELLYYHIANVCISSVAIGIFLGYDRPKLTELGVAAFVHDIGAKNVDIASKPDMFTDAEYDRVKKHPEEGVNILNKIDPGLNERILEAVRQEHERADGSGYPHGLQADDINQYAQIIGLVDVYEAMMHRRPYRDKYTSLETIRIILKNKKIFSRKVVKALIETFGIFPVDTLVQLNTKEIGVVVKANQDLISRPVIDILIDATGKELRAPKRVNMADNPVIYIDTCVKTQAAKAA